MRPSDVQTLASGEDRFARADALFARLRAQAAADIPPDSFAAIAAMLYEQARLFSYGLETTHGLAARLDTPGVRDAMTGHVADLRRLLAAHLVFKALAGREDEVRALLKRPARGLIVKKEAA